MLLYTANPAKPPAIASAKDNMAAIMPMIFDLPGPSCIHQRQAPQGGVTQGHKRGPGKIRCWFSSETSWKRHHTITPNRKLPGNRTHLECLIGVRILKSTQATAAAQAASGYSSSRSAHCSDILVESKALKLNCRARHSKSACQTWRSA